MSRKRAVVNLDQALAQLPRDTDISRVSQMIANSDFVAAIEAAEKLGRLHGANSRFWMCMYDTATTLNMQQEAGSYLGVAGVIRRLEELGEEAALWLRDGDSHYVGARRMCTSGSYVDPVFIDAFFSLAHGALERYLKGILSATDSHRYTSHKLKRKFGHDLIKLLRFVRKHASIDITHIDWVCDVLSQEFDHARYLVSANPSQLLEDAGALKLEDLDRTVCGLRNQLVQQLKPEVVNNSLLVSLYSSNFPFAEQREAFLRDNKYAHEFHGLQKDDG